MGATLRRGAQTSCGGLSGCRVPALGARASVVSGHRLSSRDLLALECVGFSNCDAQA